MRNTNLADSPAMLSLTSRLCALHRWRADLAAWLAGLLSAVALPRRFVLPGLLVGIPVLLCLIQGAPGLVPAARRGWWFGFGLNVIGLYWITEAILIEAARFWWLVPFAVPGTGGRPGMCSWQIPAALAKTGATRLACGLRLPWPASWVLADIAPPVRRDRVSPGTRWAACGSFPARLGDVMIQAASAGRRARDDAGHLVGRRRAPVHGLGRGAARASVLSGSYGAVSASCDIDQAAAAAART